MLHLILATIPRHSAVLLMMNSVPAFCGLRKTVGAAHRSGIPDGHIGNGSIPFLAAGTAEMLVGTAHFSVARGTDHGMECQSTAARILLGTAVVHMCRMPDSQRWGYLAVSFGSSFRVDTQLQG
jgi:hypothetical protein